MPAPIALTLAYLATNLAFMVWLERQRANDRPVAGLIVWLAAAVRYGPPLAGAIYLVAISGDWPFVVFVLAFFAGAGWLMNGLLAYTNHGPDGPGRRGRTRNDR